MDQRRRRSAKKVGSLLACLSHPTRLMIACLLLHREHYGQELLTEMGTTKGNISQHLAKMQKIGLIAAREQANRVWYRVADPRLKALVSTLEKLYCPELSLRLKGAKPRRLS